MHCMAALSGSMTLAVAVLVLAEVYTLVAGITLPDIYRVTMGGGTQLFTVQEIRRCSAVGSSSRAILVGLPGKEI